MLHLWLHQSVKAMASSYSHTGHFSINVLTLLQTTTCRAVALINTAVVDDRSKNHHFSTCLTVTVLLCKGFICPLSKLMACKQHISTHIAEGVVWQHTWCTLMCVYDRTSNERLMEGFFVTIASPQRFTGFTSSKCLDILRRKNNKYEAKINPLQISTLTHNEQQHF